MTAPLTEEELLELERLEKEVTAGEWSAIPYSGDLEDITGYGIYAPDDECIAELADCQKPVDNAIFIAAARNALPKLLAEVRRLRGRVAELETKVKEYADDNGRLVNMWSTVCDSNEYIRFEVLRRDKRIAELEADIETLKLRHAGEWFRKEGAAEMQARAVSYLHGWASSLNKSLHPQYVEALTDAAYALEDGAHHKDGK